METYLGTKQIAAMPMNRASYNTYRGWDLPADEDGLEPGYLVEYLDSPDKNHPNHANYISWSPKEVFEKAYRPVSGLSFGLALDAMKLGFAVARTGWNGKNMCIFLTKGRSVPNNKERSFVYFDGENVQLADHIDMRAADGSYVSGWLASQTDMLSEDWMILF